MLIFDVGNYHGGREGGGSSPMYPQGVYPQSDDYVKVNLRG